MAHHIAARIEQACKEHQHRFLASAEVVSAMDMPTEFTRTSIGRSSSRAWRISVELFTITRADRSTVV
jgi:hypothetical protein